MVVAKQLRVILNQVLDHDQCGLVIVVGLIVFDEVENVINQIGPLLACPHALYVLLQVGIGEIRNQLGQL